MTEKEARAWMGHRFSPEVLVKLEVFANLIAEENKRQNLVAPASIANIWGRHIVDSAQLTQWGGSPGLWVDIGAGAGFPGVVIGVLRTGPVLLVEPRRRRAEFLTGVVGQLGLSNIEVAQCDVRKVNTEAAYISARAVAPLPALLEMAAHLASESTLWILPKGRSANEELESARASWQGVFHVEQSITAPDAKIVIASNVAGKNR